MSKLKTIFIVFLFFVLSGCSALKTALAMMQTTDDFSPYGESNSRVFQETEPSPLAAGIESVLTQAIDVVEKEQYKKFPKPVKIYAISTLSNVKKYCGYRKVLGCVINDKVFMSPRLLNQPEGTLPRTLTHELSHLHFAQQLSLMEQVTVPTWFREGLAVYVSTKNDASAKIDLEEAKVNIQQGTSFYPNEQGSLLFQKDHISFQLSRRMFYREAASFVQFLHDADNKAFRNLLLSVQDKQPFSSSFAKCYGVTIDTKWNEFVAQEKTQQPRVKNTAVLRLSQEKAIYRIAY